MMLAPLIALLGACGDDGIESRPDPWPLYHLIQVDVFSRVGQEYELVDSDKLPPGVVTANIKSVTSDEVTQTIIRLADGYISKTGLVPSYCRSDRTYEVHRRRVRNIVINSSDCPDDGLSFARSNQSRWLDDMGPIIETITFMDDGSAGKIVATYELDKPE